METSDEYWKLLDSLIEDFRQENQEKIADDLKKGKGYANGLTDGWFDFLSSMRETLKQYELQMTLAQKETLKKLIDTLNNSLKRNR